MTFDELRKRVFKQAGIRGGIALGLVVVFFILSSILGGMENDRDQAKRAIGRVNNDIHTLEEQYTKAKASVELFEKLSSQNGDPERMLSRRRAKIILDQLNNTYHLTGLKLKMTPVKDLDDKRFKRETVVTEGSIVSLEFGGLTDVFLLDFIKSLSEEFSGYVRISSLKLERKSPMTNDTLLFVSRGEYPVLVDGELDFNWLGLRDLGAKGAEKPREAELDVMPEPEPEEGDEAPAPEEGEGGNDGAVPSTEETVPLPVPAGEAPAPIPDSAQQGEMP